MAITIHSILRIIGGCFEMEVEGSRPFSILGHFPKMMLVYPGVPGQQHMTNDDRMT